MELLGHTTDEFGWDFPMATLENNICNMLGNRLMLTTPLEVGGTLMALAAHQ